MVYVIQILFSFKLRNSSSFEIGIDTILFCSFDVIALVVQAVGGGMASTANDQKGATLVSSSMILTGKYINSNLRGEILCSVELSSNWVRRWLHIKIRSELLTLVSPVSLIVYVICATEFFLRFFKDKPIREAINKQSKEVANPRIKMMIRALIFSTVCLFIRYIMSHL